MSLGEFAFFEITGRTPTPPEEVMFDAMVISLVEHGLTPSALATRLTYAGAPESLQAAVAAGVSGLGIVIAGTMEGAARMLVEALAGRTPGEPLDALARDRRLLPEGGAGSARHRARRSTSRSTLAPSGCSRSSRRTASPGTTCG